MKRFLGMTMAAVLTCALVMVCPGAWAQDAAQVEKAVAAVPSAARVKPDQPRKVLIFTLCNGFPHSSVALGAKAIEAMGQKTGAFESVISDDISMFEPDKLKQFDAVVMDNTTGELFTPKDFDKLTPEQQKAAQDREAALKASFLDFVKSGKGLVGIHAATDCFYKWAEYGEMMGGYFSGHPWHEPVGIKIDDPAHPVNAAFMGLPFTITDEIYQFREPYSRDKLRILLSLDVNKIDMTKDSINRADKDFAVSWVNTYGKGRIFYCSLGHREEIFWNAMILQHYLDGIQYALGDLPGDATPSAQLAKDYAENTPVAVDSTLVASIVKSCATVKYGESPSSLDWLNSAVTASVTAPAPRAILATAIAEAMLASDTTPAGRAFLARRLEYIATDAQIPALSKLVMRSDKETVDLARIVLERMESPAAEKTLLKAFKKSDGAAKAGIAASLGARKSAAAVSALARASRDKNIDIAQAACNALGQIGGKKAMKPLGKLAKSGPDAIQAAAADAYLRCADALLADDDKADAAKAYQFVYNLPKANAAVKEAAFRGVVLTDANGLQLVIDALAGADPRRRTIATGLVSEIPGGETATKALAAQFTKLAPEAKAALIEALSVRGDKSVVPDVAAQASAAEEEVRTAVWRALARFGGANEVPVIAQGAAFAKSRTERDVARLALDSMLGTPVEAAIIAGLDTADPKTRAELLRSIGARHVVSALPVVRKSIENDPEERVRIEALRSYALLATTDQTPDAVAYVIKARTDAERAEACRTLIVLANLPKKMPAGRAMMAPVLEGIQTTQDAKALAALFSTLPDLGSPEGLPVLKKALASKDAVLHEAAARALAAWPTATPLDAVLGVARSDKDEVLRVVATRGVIRMLPLPSGRTTATTLALVKELMTLAQSVDDKRGVIAGLANEHHPDLIAFVERYVGDPDLKADAEHVLPKMKSDAMVATASCLPERAGMAIDDDVKTCWITDGDQRGGEWFMVDLGWPKKVSKVIVNTGISANEYPHGWELYVGNNPEDFGKPVASDSDGKLLLEIAIKPTMGRYVKIVQKGQISGHGWYICDFKVETQ